MKTTAARLVMLAGLVAGLGSAAQAQQGGTALRVTVSGVHNDRGEVLAAVCAKDTFLTKDCPLRAAAPARAGSVTLEFPQVPPGTYAVQVFHDENANRDLDRSFFGQPKEGMGFSNDARMNFGPPDFGEAAVTINGGAQEVAVPLHYFE